jgi:hypothetical protein
LVLVSLALAISLRVVANRHVRENRATP